MYFEHKIQSGLWYLFLLGHTAETINKHEDFVLGLWEELKRKTARKKCKLNDAIELHKLNNEVRSLCLARFTFLFLAVASTILEENFGPFEILSIRNIYSTV